MRQFSFGISVYGDGGEQQTQAYLARACELGCGEVFSSLHLPELGLQRSLATALTLARQTHALGMQFSLDVSGAAAARLLAQEESAAQLRAAAPDWMRLDYGFDPADALRLAHALALPGLMLNASVLTAQEAAAQCALLRREAPDLRLRAHHNFYPLPGSGLSMGLLRERSGAWRTLDVPVTACVAAHAAPRLPLCAGLPTVEALRDLPSGPAALQLLATGVVDDILIGDPFASEQELVGTALACGRQPVCLGVVCEKQATPEERRIVFAASHRARPDAAALVVRCLDTRQMATPGAPLSARPCGARRRGDVVLCNENALRYSGELQVQLADAPSSPLFNRVGRVAEEELWQLDLIGPGTSFALVPR